MNERWSLDSLYKGYDDPAYEQDFQMLDQCTDKINAFPDWKNENDKHATLTNIIEVLEEMVTLSSKLGSFISLSQSTNTQDSETTAQMNRFQHKLSESSKAIAMINRFIANIDDLEAMIAQDEALQPYQYMLIQTKADAKYLLSDEVEEVITKMDLSGGTAWGDMQSYLTSIVTAEYEGKEVTLSEIRNMAYSEDKDTRKKAYEAELKAYEKIDDAISFSLNEIKSQVNTISSLRGYDSPLDMTLHQSRMQRQTLDAMFAAMDEYMPVFHAYLKRKGELLGYKNGLPWFELFAPLGSFHQSFTIKDAKTYLIDHFKGFAPDLADMIETAFDEDWIDFFPRKGKVGGAFCSNLPYLKASRVLTNFDGAIGDVVTLAHELGHAYHGKQIEDHLPLNWDYSMPVAETASTFNENIIMNAAIDAAEGEEKIALIENQLQDLTQIMCDIYSRYLFETAVFEASKDRFLFAKDLKELMLECQRKAYGDGLDQEYLHPYMWVCKSHYYGSDLSFYNFPYAFGGLFARGLIVKYQQEGESFVPKYRALLHATTVSSVEDVAKMADIDVTDKAFWVSALKTAEARIQEFLELTK